MLALPHKTHLDSIALHARRPYLGSIYWQLFSVSLHAYRISDDGVRDVVLLATPCHLSARTLAGRLDRHWFRRHQSSFYNTDISEMHGHGRIYATRSKRH